jgi:hypothetical protein
MNENSNSQQVSPNDVEPIVTRDINNADKARADALDGLLTLRKAKASMLAREQSLLTAKYGAKDPRVAEATMRATANKIILDGLTIETVRARTQIPTVDKSTYAVYGYVYMRDGGLGPAPDLTVALVDRNGRWMEAFGHACTDQNGYYELPYTPAGESSPTMASTAGSRAEETTLFIQVSNQQQQVLLRDTSPVLVKLGEVEHRDITLNSTKSTCQPPPAEVRADFHEAVKPARAPQAKQTRSRKKKR